MELSFIHSCLTHCLYPDHPPPLPPPDTDWDRVYVLLRAHRLTGLFYALGRAHSGLLPPELRERLREDRYRALLRSDWCTERVHVVLTALHQACIPVIVLKGWALIPTVYGGDHGQRSCQDIDLLVHPEDAARAEDILHDLGYRGLMIEPWPGYRRRYCNSRTFLPAQEPDPLVRPFGVGLHWGLLDTPFYDHRMPVNQFFERARPLQVTGVDVYTLAVEDHLVYSCGHLALHHEYDDALLRDYEMATLILQTGPALAWDAVTTRAFTWRLIIPVRRVLGRLEALWPGIVSPQALETIKTLRPTLAERYVHRLVVENRGNRTVRVVLAWLTMPGLGKRLLYLLETVFPSPIHLQDRYGPAPGGLWPLLYLRHAIEAVRYITR